MLSRASPQIGHDVLGAFSIGVAGARGVSTVVLLSVVRCPHDVQVRERVEPNGMIGMKNKVKNLLDSICVCAHVAPQCEQV
jgi:hypothetical protein